MTRGEEPHLGSRLSIRSRSIRPSMKKFEFENLFVLDMANNHQGDLRLGLEIIHQLSQVAMSSGIRAGIKFQFRDLDTFIHPDYADRSDLPHLRRFRETKLTPEDFETMVASVREAGLYTICTPFDERSVDVAMEMKFDVLKIASCSLSDWPLVTQVAKKNIPIIASTGGAQISEIDRVVHILAKAESEFALMHCVGIYPTPISNLELNQIEFLCKRYPEVPIGWSTHEDPDDLITVQLAVAKGAKLFERHVGVSSESVSLNKYSSTPSQIQSWIDSYKEGILRCGSTNRGPATKHEKDSLDSLKRGVYVNRGIKSGEQINSEDVFFAMPLLDDQVTSGNFVAGGVVTSSLSENMALSIDDYDLGDVADLESPELQIDSILLLIRGMLREARIQLSANCQLELSHHYGLSRFREFGAVLIEVVNREYCKKLIVQLPRQKLPYHFHEGKEETFHVLHGSMEVELNGEPTTLSPGDLFLVRPNDWHKFSTLTGVIFEELSTKDVPGDSVYQDEPINRMQRQDRKTVLPHWQL